MAEEHAANQVIGDGSTNSAATLIYGGPGATSSFGGTIQDAIGNGNQHTALTVTGGLLNLSGGNTYTGGTTMLAGTLQLGGASCPRAPAAWWPSTGACWT